MDADHRHAIDGVAVGKILGLRHLRAHAETLPGLLDLGDVQAAFLRESQHVFLAVDRLVLHVEAVEGLRVHRIDQPQRLPRVEDLLVDFLERVELHRHAAEVHVGRQLGDPRLDRGFEGEAVRAAVPEELDHLDLARPGQVDGSLQLQVVLPFDRDAGLRERDAGQAEAGQRRHAGHASQLQGKLAPVHEDPFRGRGSGCL